MAFSRTVREVRFASYSRMSGEGRRGLPARRILLWLQVCHPASRQTSDDGDHEGRGVGWVSGMLSTSTESDALIKGMRCGDAFVEAVTA